MDKVGRPIDLLTGDGRTAIGVRRAEDAMTELPPTTTCFGPQGSDPIVRLRRSRRQRTDMQPGRACVACDPEVRLRLTRIIEPAYECDERVATAVERLREPFCLDAFQAMVGALPGVPIIVAAFENGMPLIAIVARPRVQKQVFGGRPQVAISILTDRRSQRGMFDR